MSASINPDIITDGLVLCLDAANPDCFRGEPTANLITGSFVDGFGYSTVISSNEIDQYGVVRSLRKATINNISGWNRVVVSSSIGIPILNRDYTISMWIKRVGDISVTAGWEPEVGPGDGYLRPNIESGYIGTAGASPQPNTVPTEWTYITYSFKYTSTTTTNLLLLFYINGNVGAQILFSDPQVETKLYATPYVNGTRDGTVATGGGLFDLSNNNNHGTIVRNAFPTASFYNSSNKGSLVFDGVDDYVNYGTPSISVGKITVNAWVKINTGSLYQHIVDSSISSWHLAILNDNRPYFWNGHTYHTAAPILTIGQGYMLTGVQGTTLDIYVNGVLGQSIASNVNVSTNTVNLGRWQGNGRPFNGNISQVSIYNRPLSPAEILQNYKATKGRFGL